MASSLVFDMDGTLVDSSSGILSALNLSLSEFGYYSIEVNSTHVGPPLASVFQKLLPCVDDFRINQLCLSFQHHYDNSGYLNFRPYPGIAQVLEALTLLGCRLFIVTNKRAVPTQKIIDLLEWNHYFEFVYSLDICDSPVATKVDSLSSLLLRFNLDPLLTPYLGDRFDDYLAAISVSMPFLWAEWGYASRDELHGLSDVTRLASPYSLMTSSFLNHFL
jgi:phosphoglycolate phosphatase